jgi:hypothetical protein
VALTWHGVRIVIDLTEDQVLLAEPDDFGRFSVVVEGAGSSSLAEVVRQAGLGRLREDGDHVAVDPVALRSLAGAAATDTWDEGLAAMVAYAAGKGWVEADGAILAHVEWQEG